MSFPGTGRAGKAGTSGSHGVEPPGQRLSPVLHPVHHPGRAPAAGRGPGHRGQHGPRRRPRVYRAGRPCPRRPRSRRRPVGGQRPHSREPSLTLGCACNGPEAPGVYPGCRASSRVGSRPGPRRPGPHLVRPTAAGLVTCPPAEKTVQAHARSRPRPGRADRAGTGMDGSSASHPATASGAHLRSGWTGAEDGHPDRDHPARGGEPERRRQRGRRHDLLALIMAAEFWPCRSCTVSPPCS